MTAALKQEPFKDYIKKELHLADSSLSCEVKNYLADLLYFYLRGDRFYEYQHDLGSDCEKTFVSLYGKIHSARTNEKIYLFKKMGDLSLYISGFFRSSIQKKVVDVSYYENMGQSAYGYLADCYSSQSNVFQSLYQQFKDLAENLFYIQKKSELRDNKNSIALYKEYMEQKHPSSALKRLLQESQLSHEEEME